MDVSDVPAAAWSLGRREELRVGRSKVLEGYRTMMKPTQ